MSALRRRRKLLNGGSGGGSLPAAQGFFDSDGGTSAWYTSTQFSSFYDSAVNKTFIAFESLFTPPSKRFPRVKAFDHTAQTFGRSYSSGTESALTNDDHGVPSIALNADGRIVKCWGNHDGNFHLAISTNAHDETLWTSAGDLVGSYAYPHLVLMPDNSMIVLMRKDFAPGTGGFAAGAKVLVYRPLTFAGTVITIGAEVTIGDMGNDSRWYQGDAILLASGRVAQVCTRADYGDTLRANAYYYEIDITNLRLQSFSGTTVAFPVTNTDMTNTFKVYSTTGGNTSNTPGFVIDANNRVHIVTHDGTTTDGGGSLPSTQTLKYIIGAAGAFAGAVDVGTTTQRYNSEEVIPYPDGRVRLLWDKDIHALITRGGAIQQRVLASNAAAGAFGLESTLMDYDTTRFALSSPINPRNAHADIRAIWFERAPTSNDSDGGKHRLFAWGDSGLKTKTKPALVSPLALTGDGFWLDLSSVSRIFEDAGATDTAELGDEILKVNCAFGTGNQMTGGAGTGPFLDQIGEQLCLRFSGSSAGTRYLTSAAKQWTAGPGFMCTAIFRHWMPSTASLSLISLDAGIGQARCCQPVNVNGREIRSTAFNGTVQTLLTHGAGADAYVNDYIVQCYTTGSGLNLVESINGAIVAGPTVITGGAINTTSVIMRVGASAVAAPSQFFMGACMGMVFRSGEQTTQMRDSDYAWALTQLPL